VRVFSGTTLIKTSAATATATSLSVTGLRNGVSYTATVSATNANGASAQSPKSNVVIPR
jgi:titin